MSESSPQSSQWSSSEEFCESSSTVRGNYWTTLGTRLKRRVNLAWWVSSFIPWWVGLLLCGGVVWLLLRNRVEDLVWWWPVAGTAGLLVVAALVSWRRASARFITSDQALAKLDAGHSLHNALTTAHAGVGAWPDPNATSRDHKLPVRWRIGRTLAMLCVPMLFFLLAGVVPVASVDAEAPVANRPAVWERINEVLADHVLDELADPERIEALQREMERLEDRPVGDWFDHASLETSDRIEQLLDAGLENMEQNLSRAGNLVPRLAGALGDEMEELDDATREKLAREMQQAIEQLQNQPLGLDPELAQRLQQAAPEALRNMDPQQAQQLADDLREWAEKAGEQRDGQGQGEKPLWEQLLEQEGGGPGEGEGQPGGDGENQPGEGGVTRGRGDAPMSLKEDESQLRGTRDEHLKGDGSMQPGEKLGETLENREVERVEVGPRAGGEAAAEGQGGDRVWRQSLSPDEQNLLEGYFK
ncbi:DUF4175 domain-containing protein [Sulfuriroseicoccus oceanibius]|uniref:Uncharacterized protein n=1 Tax=Sulfuriroseicoccus oceanibius TaxID=2707525 RepID=A0A6B3L4N9_9BACT|nr:DUF4175 domain-containing protein [Sulfuriroseicoccus oceanibius]QQL45115.1 hypothetical protein G3M56_000565 [Sulfuriroseicoccus oceanibius]